MSHVSSISNSSYAFRGTLSRLDKNGDGVLSREELAAAQDPGIFAEESDTDTDGMDTSQTALGNIIAMLMQSPPDGGVSNAGITMMSPSAGQGGVSDLQSAMDAVYRNTYGQFDMDSLAA